MSPFLHTPSHNHTFHPSRPYYRILGLPEPPTQPFSANTSSSTHTQRYGALDGKQVKAAYRAALLRAHPDKRCGTSPSPQEMETAKGGGGGGLMQNGTDDGGKCTSTSTSTSTSASTGTGTGTARSTFTIDDVKEAYTVLSLPETRREYDKWLARQRLSRGILERGGEVREEEEDFVLGLEVWDLADFVEQTQTETETESETVWTHACRCGSAPGFLIREAALEEAAARGEGEVLVGCGGCSLWVRVGFGVEEGER